MTLVLRFADLGIVTYASLRIVGRPERTVTWVIEEPILLAALDELAAALPEPRAGESSADALERALQHGSLATTAGELQLAYRLGALLLSAQAWRLVREYADEPDPTLVVAPSARLARVPWAILAAPAIRPTAEDLVRARAAAMTTAGRGVAQIPWPTAAMADLTDGTRLVELVDVLFAVPVAIGQATRETRRWAGHAGRPPLLVLDPRIPGQLPDSALGSVLGKPSADTTLGRYFDARLAADSVLPAVRDAVSLFRRADADRDWLAGQLAAQPSRLVFVGHASSDADDAGGAAIWLAEPAALTAAEMSAAAWPIPSRVALLACASGGDYRFDEARGLVAAMVLCGAELVTAVLWSLPTTAGYHRFLPPGADPGADPMGQLVAAVDDAHQHPTAGRAVNQWQRKQLNQWRAGLAQANPLFWAALATFAVGGAR